MDRIHSHSKNFNDIANKLPSFILDPLSNICNEQNIELGLPLMILIYFSSLFFGIFFGSNLLTFSITMLYPIFKSIQAINSSNEDDQKQWLSYWVIYSFTTVWEWTGGIVLSYILPLFWLWKLLFWIWLMAP